MRVSGSWAVALGVAACAALTVSGAPAQEAYPPTIHDVRGASVVKISGRESSGTGFIVSEEGHLITALHVLEHVKYSATAKDIPTRIKVSILNNYFCNIYASLVGASAPLDIAVYRIEERIGAEGVGCHKDLRPLPVDWQMSADRLIGKTVYMIGNPKNCDRPGERSCFDVKSTTITTGIEAGGSLADRTSSEGFSGGPVLTYEATGAQTGKASVVGMILATGYDSDNQAYTRIMPMSSIKRAFWGFGITAGEHVRDYTPALGRLLDKAAVIEESPTRLAALSDEIEQLKNDANAKIAALSHELELMKTRVEWTLGESDDRPVLALAPVTSAFHPIRFEIEVNPLLSAAFTRSNAIVDAAGPSDGAIPRRPHTIEIVVGGLWEPELPAHFMPVAPEHGGGGRVMFFKTFRQILEVALEDVNKLGNFRTAATPDDASSYELRVHTTLSDGQTEIRATSPGISIGREKFAPGT